MDKEYDKRMAINNLYIAIHCIEESKNDSELRDAQERKAIECINLALTFLR